MSLNIKGDEAHELTRELARLTGENLTQAMTTALQERLERVRREHSGTQASGAETLLRSAVTPRHGCVSRR